MAVRDVLILLLSISACGVSESNDSIDPTIVIAILVRNKAHALPFFFGALERLNYPKQRLGLWIRSDHNVDNSSAIVERWLSFHRPSYHIVDYLSDTDNVGYVDEGTPTNWTFDRFQYVMRLRQLALKFARKNWADFLFVLDADVILDNPDTLRDLLRHRDKTVVGPLLNCTSSESYSNFWGDMTAKGYYKRSPDYFDIRSRYKEGLFAVPMIHTALLINLNHRASLKLSFDSPPPNYNGPVDDVIVFSRVVQHLGLKMYLDNTRFYGYFSMPLDDSYTLQDEMDYFVHLKMEAFHDVEGKRKIQPSSSLPVFLPPKSKLGFDKIYLINLARRPDRLAKMRYCFDELGIQADLFVAVDGKTLNETYLKQLGVKQLEGYADPYHNRSIKMGEVGCFLSHYFIWRDVIDKNYDVILLFEDDIRFQPFFVRQLRNVMNDAKLKKPDWELLYVGRKRLNTDEDFLENSQLLVDPSYTYWTLSYILNRKGAQKLLAQKPLSHLVAVDEYLPIMFDRHPREDWKKPFHPRNLVAISAEPLLVEPTHYTGAQHYISDTEDSPLIRGGKDEL